MISDKTKQLFGILKWQALVVSVQDIYKMDAIFQCRGIFYKFECSCKDCVELFNFCVQIKKDVKYVKEFHKIRYLFLLFFLGPLYLVLLLPTPIVQPRVALREEKLRQ